MLEQRGARTWIKSTRGPFILSFALFVTSFALMFAVVQPTWFDDGGADDSLSSVLPQTFGGIFLRNAGVALLLFSGVVTVGLTTAAGLVVVGMYLAVAVRVAAYNAGGLELFHHVAAYSLFEISAIVLAGAAGLTPALNAFRRSTGTGSRWHRYFAGFPTALTTLAVALAALAIGAAIEARLIGSA